MLNITLFSRIIFNYTHFSPNSVQLLIAGFVIFFFALRRSRLLKKIAVFELILGFK